MLGKLIWKLKDKPLYCSKCGQHLVIYSAPCRFDRFTGAVRKWRHEVRCPCRFTEPNKHDKALWWIDKEPQPDLFGLNHGTLENLPER